MGKVGAVDSMPLNFLTELDYCSMGFGEIIFLKCCDVNNLNSGFLPVFTSK